MMIDNSAEARTEGASALEPVAASSRTVEVGHRPPVERFFETIVEASFDLIEEFGNIDLAVYLHAPHDDQPVLFLRSPDLQMLNAVETFRMMHTITMLSNGRKPTAAFRHGDLDGHYVRTTGPFSDGLYVFGGIQEGETARRITQIVKAFGRVLHQFHLGDEDDQSDVPAIEIETFSNLTRAEATIRVGDDEIVGSSSATAPGEAVARSVMAAIAPDYTFDEIRTLDLGNRSAVLAVLRDDRRHLRLGLAISAGDIIRTTALATRRAITQNINTT